jgi:uncharacterized protein YecE (DUF72 family)
MNTTAEPQLWFGTSGLVLPVPNKQAFPPKFRAGTRLTFYASLFNSLEVNSSFYKIPLPGTFSKWTTEVPENFRFSVKLWQGITHEPQLSFTPAEVDKFMHAANQLATKKGCLLIQFPPSLQADKTDQLQHLLERIKRSDPLQDWNLAVEFRNKTWYTPEVENLLSQFQTTRVLHDMPASKIMETTGDLPFVYLRFHGPAGDYKGSYGKAALKVYAEMIQEWQIKNKEVYVYFNNTIGDAIKDLEILRAQVT